MSQCRDEKKTGVSPKCMPVIPVDVEHLETILFSIPCNFKPESIYKDSGNPGSDVGDVFNDFIFECCEKIDRQDKIGDMTSRHDMYERYKVWSNDRGYKVMEIDVFTMMADRIFELYRYKRKWYYTVNLR